MHSIVMDYIGKQKVPIAWVFAILSALFIAHSWADVHFITAAKGAEESTEMKRLIRVNGTLIRDHLKEYEQNELRKDMERVKNQQYEVKQFVAINGPNQLSNDRLEELKNELSVLEGVEACMNAGLPKCR